MKNGVKPHAVFSTKNKSKDPKETHANTIKDEHLIPENELLIRLQTDPVKGLTYAEAASRLERDGKNELTPPKKQPEIVSYLLEMVKGFGPLMMCAAGLSLLAYLIQVNTENAVMDSFYVFIVLVAIIILGGTLGYIQKHRSEKIMESFKTIIAQNATVMRNGGWESISAAELVIGDIVEIRAGERIPADLRVMSCTSLKVDNSALTGEVDPLMRNTERNEDVMESKNMCFNGTYAVEGQGQCIVLRTGDDTFIGQIAKLASDSTAELTPIGREIQHCVLVITYIAVIMGLAFCITAFALGVNWLLVVTLSIGLIAGNLPGGLLIMVTIMLSTTAKRMASRNCLVKNLEAVETLGSCSVICSDKTGTLTQNRMTVSRLWVDEQIFHNDTPNDPIGAKSFGEKSPSMPDLLCITGLCNRAKFKADEKSRCKSVASRPVIGDASESALLKLVEVISGDATSYRKANKVVAEIPFNSTNKFQVSIHLLRDTKRYLLVMKGAPERLLELCSTVAMNGEDVPRDAAWEQEYNQAYLEFGRCGERVLGFCDYHLPENLFPYPYAFDTETYNFPLVGLRFVGLISLMDPPRATVPEAVRKCREAGIRVIMVTGDHPLTAKAIARQVGILSADAKTVDDLAEELSVDVKDVNPQLAKAAVITGLQLRDLTNDQLDKVLATHQEIVFARTSPVQKQIIVEACQRGGAIVAVTGDGVNDAPALKKANIGISMGITGSAVSEQAADMVLLDDNFASIVGGVEEGEDGWFNFEFKFLTYRYLPELNDTSN